MGLQPLEFLIGIRDNASKKLAALHASISRTCELADRMSNKVTDSVANIGAGAAGVFGAGMSMQSMIEPAIDFNRALGEVASLGVDGNSLKILEQEAKLFASNYGGSAADVVRASYDIQSAIAGLSGQELGSFTVASGVLAKATKADVATITSYMGTMYGIFQNEADGMGRAEWVDQLAGRTAYAVQMFKTTGSEMAASFSSLGANATAAGIAAQEQMAILGTLQATMSGSEAGTKYKAFLAGIGNAQSALGLKLTDEDGNMLGMVDILEKLQAQFGDSLEVAEADLLKKAFGSDEAVALIKQLMMNTDGLAESIEKIGQIESMKHAQEMAAKMTDIWAKLGGAVNTAWISFGQVMLPTLEAATAPIVENINTLTRWISTYSDVFRWVGYAIMAWLSAAAAVGVMSVAVNVSKLAFMGIATPLKMAVSVIKWLTRVTRLQAAAQWLLNVAMRANPLMLIITAVSLLVGFLGDCLGWWDKLKASLGDTAWGNALIEVLLAVLAPFRLLWKLTQGTVGVIAGFFGFGDDEKSEKAAKLNEAINNAAPPAPPAPPAPLESLTSIQKANVPAGGIMRNITTLNARTNSQNKTTTIGSVVINTTGGVDARSIQEEMALA